MKKVFILLMLAAFSALNLSAAPAVIVEPETEPIATMAEAVPITGIAVSSAAILALEVKAQEAGIWLMEIQRSMQAVGTIYCTYQTDRNGQGYCSDWRAMPNGMDLWIRNYSCSGCPQK